MEDVLDVLNVKILDQCRRNLGKDKIFADEYNTLDIDEEIDQMNPILWKAICMLTRSASERRGTVNEQTSSNEQHKKKAPQKLQTTQKRAHTAKQFFWSLLLFGLHGLV